MLYPASGKQDRNCFNLADGNPALYINQLQPKSVTSFGYEAFMGAPFVLFIIFLKTPA